jgi:uncharacterized delta-60 repeat protein
VKRYTHRKMTTIAAVLLSALMLFSTAQAALASAGGYDCSFADFGKMATLYNGGWGQAKAIDIYTSGPQQGKIVVSVVVGYDFGAIRLNADGSLDTSFGTGGFAPTVDFFGSWDYPNGVAAMPDGSVVLGGQANNPAPSGDGLNRLAAVRYTTDGVLDTSFGNSTPKDGKFVQKIGAATQWEYWIDMDVDSSGNIFIAGKTQDAGGDYKSTVVKLDSTGSLATTWTVDFGTGFQDEIFNGLVVQSDDKVVAAGSYYNGTRTMGTLVRFTTTGALDTTFNATGKKTFTYSATFDEVRDVVQDNSGNIVVGFGSSPAPSSYDYSVARITPSGAMDTSFNTTGIATPKHVGTGEYPYAVLAQADGKVVIGGWSEGPFGVMAMTLVRWTSAGALDASFGSGGVLQMETTGNSQVLGLAQQSTGKLLVAGYVGGSPTVLRLHDLEFDMRFGATRLTQVTDTTFAGLTDQNMMHVEICMDGSTNPVALTGVQMTTNGSTDPTDIAAAKLYTTSDGTFAATTKYGSGVTLPSGPFSFAGSQTMLPGDNHFWLAYDVASEALPPHVLDATLEGLTFSGAVGSVTPAITDPTGSRTILFADNTYFWITNVTLNTLNNNSGANPGGYGDYKGLSTDLNVGSSYTLSVTMEYSGYGGEAVSAFFDWNGDGDYTDPGEDFPLVASAADYPPDYTYYSATTGITVPVPADAKLGDTKFVIASDWAVPNGTTNQSGYGENEVYSLHLTSGPTAVTLNNFSGRAASPSAPWASAALLFAAGLGGVGLVVLRKRIR